ncbi:MAG: CarD family transcriptional regulator [Candidatus Promineifilaceae bacterium]|nr:CarD family transcriptional regulator [Candidatus Promineifilaceae bacterium]
MDKSQTFTKNDWVVHVNYGIGQIKGTEVKSISGDPTRYYRIETHNSTYWLPVDQIDSDLLRPLSTEEEMSRAVATLRKPPQELSTNLSIRQSTIKSAKQRNTIRAIARIVRDLRAYKRLKGGLNQTESNDFQSCKERLIEEWAIVTDANSTEIASELDDILDQHQIKSN